MSFLDGLSEELGNPLYEGLMESHTDFHTEFEEALEAAVEKELTEADYAAILDDNNPDNQMADMGPGEEFHTDAGASNDPSLESLIRSFNQLERETAEEALVRECEALVAACEGDGDANSLPAVDPSVELDDGAELAGVNEEAEEPSEGVSLESLLGAVFPV